MEFPLLFSFHRRESKNVEKAQETTFRDSLELEKHVLFLVLLRVLGRSSSKHLPHPLCPRPGQVVRRKLRLIQLTNNNRIMHSSRHIDPEVPQLPDEPEHSTIDINEHPSRRLFSGRKKAAAVVVSIVVVVAIAVGVALSVKPNKSVQAAGMSYNNNEDKDEDSLVVASGDGNLDTVVQVFDPEYPEDIIYELGSGPREPEDMDTSDAVHENVIASEKVPVNDEEISSGLTEFQGPLTDFIVTGDISRISVASNDQCANADEGLLYIELKTDKYPWENAWTLKDDQGEVILSGPPGGGRNYDRLTKYVGSLCVTSGTYTVTLTDKGADGICCEYGAGSMIIKVNGEVVASTNDSNFDKFENVIFVSANEGGGTISEPTPKPSVKPVAAPVQGFDKAQLYAVDINLLTDKYGGETGYTFTKMSNNQVLVNKAPGSFKPNTMYKRSLLVEGGKYRLTIIDPLLGIQDPGYLAVKVQGEEVMYANKALSYIIRVGYQPTMTAREKQWLIQHNNRRKAFHESQGVSYKRLVWSPDLAAASAKWVDELLKTCKISSESGIADGENVSARASNVVRDESPAKILERWTDFKVGKPYPENNSRTQVLWRATRFVGCADKSVTKSDGSLCYASVCRYDRAGNCAMGQYSDWKIPTLMNHTRCGPVCPNDTCY